MKEFLSLRPKMMTDLPTKAISTKKCVFKWEIKFEDQKNLWKIIRRY